MVVDPGARRLSSGRHWLAVAVLASLLLAPPLAAQSPTGTLTGRVSAAQGERLSGVAVTASSPSLQGHRSSETNSSGDYKVASLPPGSYRVTYEHAGFQTAARELKISAAQTTVLNVQLELGAVSDEIEVLAEQTLISDRDEAATTITGAELESLPIGRDVVAAMNLAPGVSDPGFGRNSPSISGAMTFENLWLINGVVVNENFRGVFLPLFIEDAIEETTTTLSGVSAEYGRFTGGVINTITKSGGNQWEGSLRASLTNEDWESRTPLTTSQIDDINQVYEATLGGFLRKNHLWIFAAGRDRQLRGSSNTSLTNLRFPTSEEETRLEGKLTATPHPSHSLIGSYFEIDEELTGVASGPILDLRSVIGRIRDPQEMKAVNYTGILTRNLLVEAQYSERDFVRERAPVGVRDLIEGTPIRTRARGFSYWVDGFLRADRHETRDNKDLLVKGSYFLGTRGAGTHDIVFGYDRFDDQRFDINHQTPSDFAVFGSDIARNPDGSIPLDPVHGSPFPIFDPSADAGKVPWVQWLPPLHFDVARPASFQVDSYYLNDRWQLSDRWSFNLGVRFDENHAVDRSGAVVASGSKLSPRLGASLDLRGDGDLMLNASYGRYVAALTNRIADAASIVGRGNLLWTYGGPPLNVGCLPGIDCLSADQLLREVFAWYRSQGGVIDFDQFDPEAPINRYLTQFVIPGATTRLAGGIESPSSDELTLGLATRQGDRGFLRADLVYRSWEDFYGLRTTLETGRIELPTGPADVSVLGNFAPGIERRYHGLHTQFRYRFSDRLRLTANYTLSRTRGNFDGEVRGRVGVEARTDSYPEYKELRWNAPVGDVRGDARHKLRTWAIYDLLYTDRHRLSVSWLESFVSGQPYAASAEIDPRGFVTNPGYATPDGAVLYYFTSRDAFRTDDIHRSDLSLSYSVRIETGGRTAELFVEPEVINLFAEEGVHAPCGFDEAECVTLGRPFDPFASTPVEGLHWEKDREFGRPLNEDSFQVPRTFRLSVGVRF